VADAKITALTELTDVVDADMLAIVDDVAGTPITKKVSRANLIGEFFEFGQIYTDAGSGSQTLSSGSYATLSQFDSNGPSSSLVTPDAANNKITVTGTGFYYVTFSLSFSGTGSTTWEGHVFWNGTEEANIAFKRRVGSGGDIGVIAAAGIIDVTTGSTDFDVRVQPDGASKDIVVEEAQLCVFRIAAT